MSKGPHGHRARLIVPNRTTPCAIQPDQECSALYKDVFLFHRKEESQHARIDELEWIRANAAISAGERDSAVNDMIELVAAVDGILRAQATADVDYFLKVSGASFFEENIARLRKETLSAYRWQYILSGASEPRFQKVMRSMITAEQLERIEKALAPIAATATVQA